MFWMVLGLAILAQLALAVVGMMACIMHNKRIGNLDPTKKLKISRGRLDSPYDGRGRMIVSYGVSERNRYDSRG